MIDHIVFQNAKVVHIVGIGGTGVSGLARLLQSEGKTVRGSDMKRNAITEQLERAGISVFCPHGEENISTDTDLVIYSLAIPVDNPELHKAEKLRIPAVTYPQALGFLMHEKRGIAIAGTHGKTTTSALVVHILRQSGIAPGFVIGGEIIGLGNSGAGNGPFLVAEACEYRRSFLNLEPEIAVITTIEEDHLDFYKDITEITGAFKEFASHVKGTVIGSAHDDRIAQIFSTLGKPTLTFGLGNGELSASQIQYQDKGNSFVCNFEGRHLGEISSPLCGYHNILNCLASIAVALILKIPWESISAAVKNFPGVGRRCEIIGEYSGIMIVDDYGHHPTEIVATLRGLRQKFPGRRIVAVFQPHQYSRTRFLLRDFAASFQFADEVIVPDIYFVRDSEAEKKLINSEILVREIRGNGTNARYIKTFEEIVSYLEENSKNGDLVLTIGAGPVNEVAMKLKEALSR